MFVAYWKVVIISPLKALIGVDIDKKLFNFDNKWLDGT